MFSAETIGDWTREQLVEFVRVNILNRELAPIKRSITQRIPLPDFPSEGQVLSWSGSLSQWIPSSSAGGGGYNLIQDEGVPLTVRTTINFTGAGVTASDSGAVTTVNIPAGGGSVTVTEVEVDFGSGVGVFDQTFTIVDAAVGAASKVIAWQSGNTATGRADGDSLWDSIDYACTPAVGSFTLYAQANPGPVSGKRLVYYLIA